MDGQGRLDIRPWLLMYLALVVLVIVFHLTGARGSR